MSKKSCDDSKRFGHCQCCLSSRSSSPPSGDDCYVEPGGWQKLLGPHILPRLDVTTSDEEENSKSSGTTKTNNVISPSDTLDRVARVPATRPHTEHRVARLPATRQLTEHSAQDSSSVTLLDHLNDMQKKADMEFKCKLESAEEFQQSTMTQHFVARKARKNERVVSQIKKREEDKRRKDERTLLSGSVPFQSEDELEISNIEIRWKKRAFDKFLKEEQAKFDDAENAIAKKRRKGMVAPIWRPDYSHLNKNDWKTSCSRCNRNKRNCDDVVFGKYCVSKFVAYAHRESIKFADLLTAKKIFVDSYNLYKEIDLFETCGELSDDYNTLYPPQCVINGSLGFCQEWFMWKHNDEFLKRRTELNKTKKLRKEEAKISRARYCIEDFRKY